MAIHSCPACHTDLGDGMFAPRVCPACGTDIKAFRQSQQDELENQATKYWWISIPLAAATFYIILVVLEWHWLVAIVGALLAWLIAVKAVIFFLGLAVLGLLAYFFLL